MTRREKIINLKGEELITILNSIYDAANGKTIDIDSLAINIKSFVKPYINASAKKRLDLIEDLLDDIDDLDIDDDIKSLADNIGVYIADAFYREPLRKFNGNNLEDRLFMLDEMSEKNNEHLEIVLIDLIRNLHQHTSDETFNINSLPSIVVGLAKTYGYLNDSEKIEFLTIINHHYDNKYDNEITAIASESKKRQIESVFSKVNDLSMDGQMEFYKDAYSLIIELYEQIAKEDKIKKCNHEMGKWKDCSYTKDVETMIDWQMCNVPVDVILYVRTCKKCGFKETMDSVPDEVRIEREEAAKQREIKNLEKRLQVLKGENKELQ